VIQAGFTVFFTGLSAAGKSTLAKLLADEITTRTGRPVTLLDGDSVRRLLSSELGFSMADRNLNVVRIAFVAREVNRHGGIVVCAAIAPYEAGRTLARNLVSPDGEFIEIHVETPLEVCEQRDPKGLYARARRGEIQRFTGVDDPYERPANPELRVDTSEARPEDVVAPILDYLVWRGLLKLR
jgi:sulfate adenylyltransferase